MPQLQGFSSIWSSRLLHVTHVHVAFAMLVKKHAKWHVHMTAGLGFKSVMTQTRMCKALTEDWTTDLHFFENEQARINWNQLIQTLISWCTWPMPDHFVFVSHKPPIYLFLYVLFFWSLFSPFWFSTVPVCCFPPKSLFAPVSCYWTCFVSLVPISMCVCVVSSL